MNKLFSILSFFCCVSLLLVSCSKDEEVMTGTINGIVTDYSNANQPVAGAMVTLTTKGISKTTGSDGRFEMEDLEPGTYTLQVQADGYQTTTKQVTVLIGETVRCDFQLQQERIDITPQNLIFGQNISQLSFSIINNSSKEQSFSITNLLKDVDSQVTPLMGTVKARSTQMVNVTINNRDQLRKTVNGQLLVNVGNTSQTVNVTVEGVEEEKPTTGAVAGLVSDYANALQPISGATVSLITTGQTQTTGSDGRYGFNDLTPGTYTLTVSANEYETATKEIKVEAGKTTTCDFQLQKGAANVEVSPLNLSFGSDVEQLSFTIKNNSNSAQQYSISNVPEFVTVSQNNGMVAAKGSQAISVNVVSRNTITTTRNGQLTVNVGNSSFIVQLTVEPYKKESVNVEFTPQALVFDRETNQLSFTITSKTGRTLDYTITNSLQDILSVSPVSGTLPIRGSQAVSVNIKGDRKAITTEHNGMITIAIEGNTYNVSVKVEKSTTVAIAGLVSDYANPSLPIAGATVSLNATGQTQTTGSDGRYSFNNLSPGTYTLTVAANDYESITKEVKVEAGKTTTCDFQLQKSAVNVDVSPLNLSFGPEVEQLSFTVKNNSNSAQQYSISNVPDFATVSQTNGMVAAKGSQAISVNVVSRKTITSMRYGQLTVNVGNSSFIVQLTVEPYKQEPVNVEFSPQILVFDKETNQLSFTITNKTGRTLDYTITNSLQDLLTISPVSGTLPIRGSQAISVNINGNRQAVTSERNGVITVGIEGNTYNISVKVEKYESNSDPGPDDPSPSEGNITRGLQAYYTFDKSNANDTQGNYDGFQNGGTYITDTPNGSGKALSLKQKQYVSVGYAPLNGKKTYTFSMWVKDFGTGCLFKCLGGSSLYGPSLVITEAMQLRYYTGTSATYSSILFNTDFSSFQSGEWTMITIVTETAPSSSSTTTGTSTLYINGKRADSGTSRTSDKGATSMTIGGQAGGSSAAWADPMKVDNVRIYSVALTDDEVASIYQFEKK